MVQINLKNAAMAQTSLPIDVAIADLPRVNAALQQMILLDGPVGGILENRTEPPIYPDDVKALGLPAMPRFYGELEFSQCPGTKLTLVQGNLNGQVPLRCQTCLAPFIAQIQVGLCLAHIVDETQESQVPDRYDPFVHNRQEAEICDLVEDDILLGLPAFPRHPLGQCQPVAMAPELSEPTTTSKKKPFAELKSMLNTNKT